MTSATDRAELAPAPGLRPLYADLIGKPFEYGGRGPETYDCYGLVSELLWRIGQQAPDYHSPTGLKEIAEAMHNATPLWTPCEPGTGALVAIRIPTRADSRVSHVGMLLPHGRFIHTWERSGGVTVERLDDWKLRIRGFYRYFPKT